MLQSSGYLTTERPFDLSQLSIVLGIVYPIKSYNHNPQKVFHVMTLSNDYKTLSDTYFFLFRILLSISLAIINNATT